MVTNDGLRSRPGRPSLRSRILAMPAGARQVGRMALAGCAGASSAPAPETKAGRAGGRTPPGRPQEAAAGRRSPSVIQRERWTGDLDGIVKRRYLRACWSSPTRRVSSSSTASRCTASRYDVDAGVRGRPQSRR
ncbi:MAG: hypothetical protein MZU95_01145 [Desulfomicrobium escambiense]|nr:hypothetical protein [Desulfomicrobium escambiense]